MTDPSVAHRAPMPEWARGKAKLPEPDWPCDTTGRGLPVMVFETPNKTDKYDLGYVPVYEWLAKILGPAAHVVEVGVYGGAGLRLFQKLFPEGKFVGIDNSGDAIWPEGTHKILADQTGPGLPAYLGGLSGRWDLIVDDCSHIGKLTRRTHELLWPVLRPGGYYVVEDTFVGLPEWDHHSQDDETMVFMKEQLYKLGLNTDVDQIIFRYGLMIMRKKEKELSEAHSRFHNAWSAAQEVDKQYRDDLES